MDISIEVLKDQLAKSEQEHEIARSYVYRCDGAIQILKHLISLAETKEESKAAEESDASS